MSAFSRFPVPFLHPINGSGTPYPGALLYFYTAGTTTPLDTYSDLNLSVPNTNPVVADANGMFGQIFLGSVTYDVVLKTSAGATIWTAEDVAAAAVSAATTTVAGIVELATTAEALTGSSTTLGMTPATVAAAIQQGFSYGTTGGTANAITVTPTVTPTALASGMVLYFRALSNNTAATTINYAGLGAVSARVDGGSGATACAGGEIVANNVYSATYSGADSCWLVSPVGFNPASANSATLGASMAPGDKLLIWDLSALAPKGMTRSTLYPFSSKTGNYTATDDDCGGTIRFSGLSADATLTLPAVSGRAGYMLTILCSDTTYGVTVDGNSSETIDGVTSRKTCGPAPVTIYCDGSAWHTIHGVWRSRSAAYTLAASTTTTFAHGLGITPTQIRFVLEALSGDAGYEAGAFLILSYNLQSIGSGSAMYGWTTQADATNVYLRCTATQLGTVVNQDTYLQANLTYGNWSVKIIAEG